MTNKEAIEYIKLIFVRDRANELHFISHDEEIALDLAIKALEERPTGEWIEITNGRGGHECNLCGEYASNYQSGREYLSAFCPNCGAKMKGEE